MKKAILAAACLVSLLFSFLFLNCSDDSSPVGPAHLPVMMPLADGNVWNYADTVSGPASLVFVSSMTVTGETVVTYEDLDYDVFTVDQIDTYNGILSTYFLRNDEFGLWEFATACGLDSMFYKQMNAKYPAEIGDEWMKGNFNCDPNQYPTGFPPGPTTCIAIDSLYTTPAGTFECYLYQYSYDIPMFGLVDIYYFYALDVGLVAKEFKSGMMNWKTALVDYDLN